MVTPMEKIMKQKHFSGRKLVNGLFVKFNNSITNKVAWVPDMTGTVSAVEY